MRKASKGDTKDRNKVEEGSGYKPPGWLKYPEEIPAQLATSIANEQKRVFPEVPTKYLESPDYILCQKLRNEVFPKMGHTIRALHTTKALMGKSALIDHTDLMEDIDELIHHSDGVVERLQTFLQELQDEEAFLYVFGELCRRGAKGEEDDE